MIINNTVGRGGSSGKDGITPHIGDNGNWFLGTEDTGVIAKAQGNTKIAEVTLLATNWDESLTQTIACEGISANEANQMVTLLPALANKAVYSSCRVTCTAFAENSLTFMAESLPEEDILVYVAMEDEHASVANDTYSTEKTVVGTWIDGKPLYRVTVVTISGSTADTATHIATSAIPSGVKIVKMYGLLTRANGTCIPVPYYESNSTYCAIFMSAAGNLIEKHGGTGNSDCELIVNIEYTKTTDTATVAIPSTTALAEAYEEGVNEA